MKRTAGDGYVWVQIYNLRFNVRDKIGKVLEEDLEDCGYYICLKIEMKVDRPPMSRYEVMHLEWKLNLDSITL